MRILIPLTLTLLVSACVSTPGEQILLEEAPAGIPEPAEVDRETLPPTIDSAASDSPADFDQPSFPVLRADDVDDPAQQLLTDYLQATDEATRSGGVETQAMAALVTEAWLPTEQRGFDEYQQRSIRTLGQTTHSQFTVQSARWTADGLVEVAVFACIDASSVWVIPADAPEPPADLIEWLGRGAPAEVPTEDQATMWQDFIDQAQPDAGQNEPVLLWMLGTTIDTLRIDATDTWRGYHPCHTAEPGQQ